MNEDTTRPQEHHVTSRYSIVILASILVGMGLGSEVPISQGSYCTLVGLAGFAWFFALELVARGRTRAKADELRSHAEDRLVCRCQRHDEPARSFVRGAARVMARRSAAASTLRAS